MFIDSAKPLIILKLLLLLSTLVDLLYTFFLTAESLYVEGVFFVALKTFVVPLVKTSTELVQADGVFSLSVPKTCFAIFLQNSIRKILRIEKIECIFPKINVGS